MLLLRNAVRTYAWGAIDGLAGLVGSAPSGGPEAELWVGTHPAAPSQVVGDPQGRTLAQVIASDPGHWLGADLAAEGARALPFLLKVLAIGAPLSLQAHPSAAQAAAGFAREEAAGVPADDPTRTYRDPNAKPEALVALEETWLLCGFRAPAEVATALAELQVEAFAPLVRVLRAADTGSRDALAWLLRLQGADRERIAAEASRATAGADPVRRDDPAAWVQRLSAAHPGDPGCLAPYLLHLVRLDPGEAVYLPAGNLHAYLSGAGVEVMTASDNVLRGGLTPKHVDVDELLRILVFTPGVPPAPVLVPRSPGLDVLEGADPAFALARVEGTAGACPILTRPSLLLATGGPVTVTRAGIALTVDHGDAVFAAPGPDPVAVAGTGTLWWATTGDGIPG